MLVAACFHIGVSSLSLQSDIESEDNVEGGIRWQESLLPVKDCPRASEFYATQFALHRHPRAAPLAIMDELWGNPDTIKKLLDTGDFDFLMPGKL